MPERESSQPASMRKQYELEKPSPEDVVAGRITSIKNLSEEFGMSISELERLIEEKKIAGYTISGVLFSSAAEIKKYQNKKIPS